MGYASIKADRRHEQDAARIRELEAQLKREREEAKEKTNEDSLAGHVVIERTSKKLKRQMLVSLIVTVVGLLLILSDPASEIGTISFIGGIIAVIITKGEIWWRHG